MRNLNKKELKVLETIQESNQLKNAQRINEYIRAESIVEDMTRFIKATKERRLLSRIENVSRGNSKRDIRFFEFNVKNRNGSTYNFWSLMVFLGYKVSKTSPDFFTIHGGGMDMNFNTHYNIILRLGAFGLLTKKEIDNLSQKTPNLI